MGRDRPQAQMMSASPEGHPKHRNPASKNPTLHLCYEAMATLCPRCLVSVRTMRRLPGPETEAFGMQWGSWSHGDIYRPSKQTGGDSSNRGSMLTTTPRDPSIQQQLDKLVTPRPKRKKFLLEDDSSKASTSPHQAIVMPLRPYYAPDPSVSPGEHI